MSNILFCVTGPSGSGKTTIMRNVMDNELLSFTTRQMREGEVNGKDYLFLNNIEFDWLLNEGMLAEYTEYDGNNYGLTMEELVTKLRKDHAFFICDNNGFNQIKGKYDNIVSIFLYGDESDCADNMLSRGDSMGRVSNRLTTYDEEVSNKSQYDYVVKNIRGFRLSTESIVQNILLAEIYKNGGANN